MKDIIVGNVNSTLIVTVDMVLVVQGALIFSKSHRNNKNLDITSIRAWYRKRLQKTVSQCGGMMISSIINPVYIEVSLQIKGLPIDFLSQVDINLVRAAFNVLLERKSRFTQASFYKKHIFKQLQNFTTEQGYTPYFRLHCQRIFANSNP